MRILLAGATGAIGRPLLTRLLADGHEVVATSRDAQRAAALTAQGAEGVVLDAFDTAAVHRVVAEANAEVVLHQLTALPENPAKGKNMQAGVAQTNRLRRETVPVFVDAARAAGARRIVVQSISFVVDPARGPETTVDETAPLYLSAPFPELIEAVRDMEAAVVGATGIDGLALRYGFYYGPGTWYAKDGAMGDMIRKRRLPIVGNGEGRYSFIHIDDAVEATVQALTKGATGVYNVVDDEPVRLRDWLPVVAEAMDAKEPRRVPAFLGRLAAGPVVVYYATQLPGVSNAKMKAAFGVQPRPTRAGLEAAFS